MTPNIEIRVHDPDEWSDEINGLPPLMEYSPTRPDASPILPSSFDSPPDAEPSPDFRIELPFEAMETLRRISHYDSPSLDSQDSGEMEELLEPPSRPKSADGVTPASQHTDYSFSKISIPSPGGFFASLGKGARHTWAPGQSSEPPSSTTAENFYNLPWARTEDRVVERIVEVDETGTNGPPTAVKIVDDKDNGEDARPSIDSVDEIRTTTLKYDFDERYQNELREQASANLNRTGDWLSQQTAYLNTLLTTRGPEDEPETPTNQRFSKHGRDESLDSPMKKAMKFLETVTAEQDNMEEQQPTEGIKKESIYYRGFQHVTYKSKRRDSFVHASNRFDAIQSHRVSHSDLHLDQLLGRYQLCEVDRPSNPRPISMIPGNKSDDAEQTPEQKIFARVERERQSLEQISTCMWIVEALRFLNGGKLLPSPANKVLAAARTPLDNAKSAGKNRVRVLDLGGQPSCDWGWHCANDYRNVKTYTVITKQQVSNPHIKGPHNHRQVSVPHLWKLPFKDGHFNVISARSLQTFLKAEKPLQESLDEYDLCLQECWRCLKPGGYLEFFMVDSELARAGPQGTKASVEFAFNLKTRGYDPLPTKTWLSRVRKAGFTNIKRAWLFLPVGAPSKQEQALRETPFPEPLSAISQTEAVLGPVGCTADAANIAGLVGGWMWEQWMLKLQMEMGKGKERLLEGVPGVMEEGRNCGAGWRCLSGWARKPIEKKKSSSSGKKAPVA